MRDRKHQGAAYYLTYICGLTNQWTLRNEGWKEVL
jgi:hypothetical protein